MSASAAGTCPLLRELATGLADCLADKDMLDSAEGRTLLVHTSSSIVDSLPRAGEAGEGGPDAKEAHKTDSCSLGS